MRWIRMDTGSLCQMYPHLTEASIGLPFKYIARSRPVALSSITAATSSRANGETSNQGHADMSFRPTRFDGVGTYLPTGVLSVRER